MRGLAQALRGIRIAVRSRWKIFAAVALAIFLLDVFLPPLLSRGAQAGDLIHPQSVAQNLPDFVASTHGCPSAEIEFLPIWRSSGSFRPAPSGEWGFAVTVMDLFSSA
jgi:hypothetical protein